jgi:hypothetical protein
MCTETIRRVVDQIDGRIWFTKPVSAEYRRRSGYPCDVFGHYFERGTPQQAPRRKWWSRVSAALGAFAGPTGTGPK